jgi:hypothetical protein
VTRQEAQIALNRAAERAWTDRDDDSMILLGRALMVLAALPEEDAPRDALMTPRGAKGAKG